MHGENGWAVRGFHGVDILNKWELLDRNLGLINGAKVTLGSRRITVGDVRKWGKDKARRALMYMWMHWCGRWNVWWCLCLFGPSSRAYLPIGMILALFRNTVGVNGERVWQLNRHGYLIDMLRGHCGRFTCVIPLGGSGWILGVGLFSLGNSSAALESSASVGR